MVLCLLTGSVFVFVLYLYCYFVHIWCKGGADAVSGVVFVFGPQERNGERHPGGDHGYIGLIMFSSSWAS